MLLLRWQDISISTSMNTSVCSIRGISVESLAGRILRRNGLSYTYTYYIMFSFSLRF